MTTALVASQVLQWLVLLVMAIVIVALAKQIGLLHKRLPPPPARALSQGPKVGVLVPRFDLSTIDGKVVSFPSEKKTLLVFVSPRCSTCEAVLPAIHTVANERKASMQTVLVSLGTESATRRLAKDHSIRLPIAASEEIGEEFNVSGTPYAFLIDDSGVLTGAGLVNHLDHLESVADATLELTREPLETYSLDAH